MVWTYKNVPIYGVLCFAVCHSLSVLTHWPLGDLVHMPWNSPRWVPKNIFDDQSALDQVMTVGQQTNVWGNVVPDLCHHVMSLSYDAFVGFIMGCRVTDVLRNSITVCLNRSQCLQIRTTFEIKKNQIIDYWPCLKKCVVIRLDKSACEHTDDHICCKWCIFWRKLIIM